MELNGPQLATPASPTAEENVLRDQQAAPVSAPRVSGMEIDPSDWVARSFLAFATLMRRYHRHRIFHLERLGKLLKGGRRVVIVANHALDVIDPMLFVATVLERYGRIPRFIGHEVGSFNVPVPNNIAQRFKVLPSRRPE